MTTSTVKALQQMTDKLVKEQQKLIDQYWDVHANK